MERIYKYLIVIKDWEVEVQLMYEADKPIANIALECTKEEDKINLLIHSDRMLKIIRQMNLEDILPY